MSAPSARRRLRIDRIDLDLRGVDPATAEAVARALGPALARTLATGQGRIASAKRIDAGRMTSAGSTGAGELATGVAQRIRRAIGGGDA